MKPSVLVISHFVSPYQVEFFNAVASAGAVELHVAYVHEVWKGRQWEEVPRHHAHTIMRDADAEQRVRRHVEADELVVFNLYRDRCAQRLMRLRHASGKPWVFWGERPAYRVKGRLGTLYRRWRLAPLRHSPAPIWGIGSWATAKYRREFGQARPYDQLPYYSDLARFRRPGPDADGYGGPLRFLFSGALSRRKGADLVGDACRAILSRGGQVRWTFVGTGPLEKALRRKLAGFGERVRFAGFQPWKQLPTWYQNADVLVAPSRYDGWGLIVPEGLAAGLPVVATDKMGAAIDLVADGENGWISPAGDGDALRKCLERVAELGPDELDRYRRQAEASVAGHQLAHGAGRFVQLCEQALQSWEVCC